ncbi:hypothetical protein [Amycolatopsis anabasis]|uniref:hypothetical protein n=1 Tax=Amycolatopsis anabasis TaxID=1840409 RepID=UPI00131B7365|nr:hypothetical protein [Amycolatopsis anabasis]
MIPRTDLTATQAAAVFTANDQLGDTYREALGRHTNPAVRAELLRHLASAQRRAAEVYQAVFGTEAHDQQAAQDLWKSGQLLRLVADAEQTCAGATSRALTACAELEAAAGASLDHLADPESANPDTRADAYHDLAVAATQVVSKGAADTLMELAATYPRIASPGGGHDEPLPEPAVGIAFRRPPEPPAAHRESETTGRQENSQ